MKYHSLKWWQYAIIEQIKHYFRNIVCRQWLRIDFGLTKPDLLTLYTLNNEEMLYKVLIQKYPELKTIKKYMAIGHSFTVTEFTCAATFYQYGKRLSVFWTNVGTVDDIFFLLRNGLPSMVTITNCYGDPHSITVVGYDDENQDIIFNDPLGDPWLNYSFTFGFNIRYSKKKFISVAGNQIRMNCFIDNNQQSVVDRFKARFNNRKLYSLEEIDFENGAILDRNNFTLIKYTKDGKVNIDLDLGAEAKNKFVHVYGEYRSTKNILWNTDNPIEIMDEVQKSKILRKLKT